MNRQEFAAYLTDIYSTAGEHLFAKYPCLLVFRHSGNRKWFAVLMDIPRKNLGMSGNGEISVVNLKCDTRLIGSFREEPDIFPGWHMNKAHWLTVVLDGTVVSAPVVHAPLRRSVHVSGLSPSELELLASGFGIPLPAPVRIVELRPVGR